jgi:hypothetical protein
MPPVKTAEPRIPIAPNTKPKLAPNARPPIMMMAQTGSNPATAPPSGLTAATTAVKTPKIAKDLESIPPCITSARATIQTKGTISNKRIEALSELLLKAESFCNKNGHKNATKPITEVTIIEILVNELTLINFTSSPLRHMPHLKR